MTCFAINTMKVSISLQLIYKSNEKSFTQDAHSAQENMEKSVTYILGD